MDDIVGLLLRWGASEQAMNDEGKTSAGLLRQLRDERGWKMDELEWALDLLASAPADRAWRRRCLLVMLRARVDKERLKRRSGQRRSKTRSSSDQDVQDNRGRDDSNRGRQAKARSSGEVVRGVEDGEPARRRI